MKKIYLAVFILFSFIDVFSQKSSGGVPTVLKKNLGINNIPVITLQTINNEEEIQRADSISSANCNSCKNNYYGRGIDFYIDIKNDGQLTELNEESSKLWTFAVESSSAFGLEFFFSDFNIPHGAELFFYSADTSIILGAYTSDNNPTNTNSTFQFATQYIKGNKIIIEYKEPNNADFEGELKISTIVHIFNDVFDKQGPFSNGSGAGSCNINVACPLGSGWENEIKSTAIILYYKTSNQLRGWCSGAVLNNTKQDGRPLFLTANHCIDGSGSGYDYNTWLVLFNHQTTTCESDGSDVSSYTGQSVPVSSVLARDGPNSPISDYCLMELQTQVEILKQWGVCYAGWDRSESSGSSSAYTVGIHHPRGDVKKISKDFDPPCSSGYNQSCGTGNYHWRVRWNDNIDEDNGVTENGSSGSPLFNSAHRIIGQLHGGASSCNNSIGPDYYGKFSDSWTNSGEDGFALYLDPDKTGQTSVNTYCPASSTSGGGEGGVTGGGCSQNYNDFIINENTSGIPCVPNGIITLKPTTNCHNYAWDVAYTKKQACVTLPNSTYCYHPLPDYWNCVCFYVDYFIEITNVDNNLNPIGNAYSKWFTEYGYYLYKVDIDPIKLSELGISLQPGKLYRIKLAFNKGGWKEAVRYFGIVSQDISYINTNLVNSFPLFNNIVTPSSLVNNAFGRNVTLNNVTTTNYFALTNNISVSASKSISISNSIITPGFVASIVDEPACSEGRMANSNDDENTKPDKYYYERVVYYNSNPKNDTISVSKNKENENSPVKASTESSYLLIPNPSSSGRFVFSSKIPELGIWEIVIFNLLGEKIYQSSRISNTQSAVDISNQPKGTYFAQIRNGDELTVQKIVYQ